MKYLLAHDIGTSGDKAALFSTDGEMLDSVTVSYDANYFRETWVEESAETWWNAVSTSTAGLLKQSGVDPHAIAGVSFSGQMMGCLPVDKNGTPLRPSIIWADQRAQSESADLEKKIPQQEFYHITGHRNTASYGIQKLMWLRDHEPDIYRRTYKVLNAKDYIAFKLTGNLATDHSDANSMGCYDIARGCWSERILSAAGIDQEKYPDIISSVSVVGEVTSAAARETGLAAGTPVIMGGGDGVVANVGCGSIAPGKTYCCLGTSAWITTTTEKPVFDPEMRTVTWAHAVPGLYAPNGTMQYAGGSFSWLKNTICLDEARTARENGCSAYDIIDTEISSSPVGANGVIFLPYMLGERAPRWDSYSRGSWIGLKPENTRADLLRSVLEGVTMNLSVCLDILRSEVRIDEIMVVGGGARQKVWREIMADVFDAEILVPNVLENAGSMGAAVIAGVGCGAFSDFTAIDRFLRVQDRIQPNSRTVSAYAQPKRLFESFYWALAPCYQANTSL